MTFWSACPAGNRSPSRRRWMLLACAALVRPGTEAAAAISSAASELTLCTFGDSVLDCGHYNPFGIDPGRLIVRNDDRLFPEFKGRDLSSRDPVRLVHRAVDGATVDGLMAQAPRLPLDGRSIAMLSIGGNDLLRGLASDSGRGMRRFEAELERFMQQMRVRPVLIATVYDPTFGDDARNFLGVPARIARANHRRVNQILGDSASRHGVLVDLHAHFLTGDASWFTQTIEPSLLGASEIRRAFLPSLGVQAS
jgi:hypothetical protein